MEQKHARAAQNIVRTHPPFSKMTWRLRNCPGNMTSFLTDGRTDTNRDLTLHSSEQKTGSSELWNLMTSRIVCWLATLGSNYNKPQLFNNYFSRLTHSYTTRGNRSLLNLPRVRTEAGHKSVRYQALIFNSLPAEIRNEVSILRFKNSLKNYNVLNLTI